MRDPSPGDQPSASTISRRVENTYLGPGELDLLRAALLPDARAWAAWQRWRAGPHSTRGGRLLPLVEWNLRQLGSVPAAAAPRGALEESWSANQRLFQAAQPVLRDLLSVGFSPVLLKGLALCATAYPSHALRPVGDLDLLLEGPEMLRAVAAMRSTGWQPVTPLPASALPHLPSYGFERRDGIALDLHSRAIAEDPLESADRRFRERAVACNSLGLPLRTLCASDHLLLVCVHGQRWSARRSPHWLADAWWLVRGGEIDWALLVAEARERDLALALARALGLLAREFDAPVPEFALAELDQAGRGWRRRCELNVRSRPPSLAGGLFVHWRTLARAQPTASVARRLLSFPAYLREMWGARVAWQLPWMAASKSVGRLAGGVRRAPTDQ